MRSRQRRLGPERRLQPRPHLSRRRREPYLDAVVRKEVPAAARRLHLALDGRHDAVRHLERLARGRRDHPCGRAIDGLRDSRLEPPRPAENVHASPHLMSPASPAAVTICPAAAAASRPPYPACSTSTAKAMRFDARAPAS